MTIGSIGLVIIPLLVSASAFGAANGSFYNSSRVIFVAAREGHAPKFLSGLHATTKTPIAAVLLQVINYCFTWMTILCVKLCFIFV